MVMKRHSKVVWPGFSNAPAPRHAAKIGRNEPCPCGSGKKYKQCHAAEGDEFLKKLAREHEKEHLAQVRKEMKEAGVPWWRRLLMRL